MKKGLSLLLIASLFLSAISFTSCNDEQVNTSSTASSTNAPHEHNYVSEITEPTYTEEGYTTYTCECGDSYVSDYVDALAKPSGELKFALWEDNESYSVIGIGECHDSEIIIPATHKGLPVTRIGEYAFSGINFIVSITIPDSVLIIDDGAFAACRVLEKITIGNSVTDIGENAFRYCDALESIVLPNSTTKIGGAAFYYCTALKSIKIPEGIETIEMGAFANCTALEEVIIPKGVKTIEAWTFQSCTSLKSVEIPDTVTYIGETAFSVCTSLETVTIPNTLTFCGEDVFKGCNALNTIYFSGSVDEWRNNGIFIPLHSIRVDVVCSDGTITK